MNATKTRLFAAAATLLALPALSACGANFGAQTDQVYTPTDGENSREGTVDVLHALVVSETPGSGRLIAGLANGSSDTEDELTGVRGEEDDQGLQFSLSGGETTIPAGGLLQLADDDSANIVVTGDEEQLRPGEFVRVTFSFANGEEATLNVPVLEPGEDYADVELPEPGSETPSETPEG